MSFLLLQIEAPPSNLPFLFAAFAVSWVGFFIYVFFVSRRRQELERELRALRRSLEQRESPQGEPSIE